MSQVNSSQEPEVLKPPAIQLGVLGWLRGNLFNTWYNSLLTLLFFAIFWKLVPPLVKWAFIDSRWYSSAEACRDIDGACWSIIPANIRFILFGFFPHDQQWRPLIAMLLLLAMVFYSKDRRHWTRLLLWIWPAAL